MAEHEEELLSGLVDGELGEIEGARCTRLLAASVALRGRWARYHLIGDVLRGDAPPDASVDLAARVRDALQSEPAPAVSVRVRHRRLAGWALAASLAAVAVLGARVAEVRLPGAVPGGLHPAAEVQARAPAQRTRLAFTGPGRVTTEARTGGLRWNVGRPDVQARLNGYLMNYSEYLGGGLRGMLPYARVVGYDAVGQ